jgi:hypothetical protein
MKKIKGFKGFNKGMKCLDFQYEENKEYKQKESPSLCESGFHFCENPLDVLDYYNLCDSEFAEVEAFGKTETDGQKTVTNKIRIGVRLNLKAFIKASVDFLWEKCKATEGENIQVASGYSSKLAASGDYSQLAASGYSSKLAASGDYSQLAASGDSSKLAASSDYSQLAASGDYSQLEITGKYSVGAAMGINNIIKASKGCWITLAEWKDNKPICVKSAQIDGKILLPDTWYKLVNGEFVIEN